MASSRNPYHWDGDQPEHVVAREGLLDDVLTSVGEGESCVLLGARGMGKSVFLAQLERELKAQPGVDVLLFSAPPNTRTVESAIGSIAEAMTRVAEDRWASPADEEKLRQFSGKLRSYTERRQLRAIVDAYLALFSVERLVLLYDELDAYAEPRDFGLYFFNDLEDVRKKSRRRLVVVAAGGLGLLTLSTIFGSAFFTRKNERILEPFDVEELEQLAAPFAERGTPLSPELLDEIRLASGGNVLLATYGLQRLWNVEVPTRRHVRAIYRDFQEYRGETLDSIWNAIFDLDLSEVPYHIWQSIQQGGGELSRFELSRLRRESKTKLSLNEKKIFDMLRASGLVRMHTSVWGPGVDPIEIECIPSILALRPFEGEIVGQGSLQEQLRHDLQAVLVRIHSMTPAFYRPSGEVSEDRGGDVKKRGDERLVPEGNFAAAIVIGLEPRGWECEVEAMSGSGYADIKARHARFGADKAIVEIKIWPRNDYKDIHEQVTDYFTDGVRAFATLMIRETKSPDWNDEYARICLEGKVDDHTWHPLGPPLEGFFEARKGSHVVHHFLLRLPTRR